MSLASFPKAMFTRTSGPALTCLLHVLPGCTASGATCAHAHACGLQRRLGPSGGEVQGSHSLSVRYRRVSRSPGVDEEGHGDGRRRCGGRGHV